MPDVLSRSQKSLPKTVYTYAAHMDSRRKHTLFRAGIFEGSLEVKLPTIWTDEKQRRAEAERRGRLEERRSEEKE